MFKVLTFLSANLLSYTLATNEEGLAFLEKKDTEEGVVKLESGLRYKVLEPGTGLHAPKVGTSCEVTYKGTLIDGTEFDSGTTSFAPNQVIKGWTEAMQLMVEGAKWELTIPSELAYGENGSPPKIPGGAVLVFEMQIHKIQGPKKTPRQMRPLHERRLPRCRTRSPQKARRKIQKRNSSYSQEIEEGQQANFETGSARKN